MQNIKISIKALIDKALKNNSLELTSKVFFSLEIVTPSFWIDPLPLHSVHSTWNCWIIPGPIWRIFMTAP